MTKQDQQTPKKTKSKFDIILNVLLISAFVLWMVDRYVIPKPLVDVDGAVPNVIEAKAAEHTPMPEAFEAFTFEQLNAAIAKSHEKPLFLFVFASWCPYCKQFMPTLSRVAEENKDKIEVLAISIDKDKAAIKQYMDSLNQKPPFTVFNQQTTGQKAHFRQFIQKYGLQYKGGIPYMAVFLYGKVAGEFPGAFEEEKLEKIVQQIDAYHRKQMQNRKSENAL